MVTSFVLTLLKWHHQSCISCHRLKLRSQPIHVKGEATSHLLVCFQCGQSVWWHCSVGPLLLRSRGSLWWTGQWEGLGWPFQHLYPSVSWVGPVLLLLWEVSCLKARLILKAVRWVNKRAQSFVWTLWCGPVSRVTMFPLRLLSERHSSLLRSMHWHFVHHNDSAREAWFCFAKHFQLDNCFGLDVSKTQS